MADETYVTKAPSETRAPERVNGGPTFSPLVDIIEKADAMIVLADMPGVARDRLSVMLEKGVLTIDGEVEAPDESGLTLQLREYELGHFHRAFEVGDGLDAAGVKASMRDGVLRLVIPKHGDLKPRKIEIAAG